MRTCFESDGFQRASICRKSVVYYKDGNNEIRLPKDGKRRRFIRDHQSNGNLWTVNYNKRG